MKVEVEKGKKGICAWDMEDGDVGEIVDWGVPEYVGRVVQRCGRGLICIGLSRDSSWNDLFNAPCRKECRVELLKDGDKLVFSGEK